MADRTLPRHSAHLAPVSQAQPRSAVPFPPVTNGRSTGRRTTQRGTPICALHRGRHSHCHCIHTKTQEQKGLPPQNSWRRTSARTALSVAWCLPDTLSAMPMHGATDLPCVRCSLPAMRCVACPSGRLNPNPVHHPRSFSSSSTAALRRHSLHDLSTHRLRGPCP